MGTKSKREYIKVLRLHYRYSGKQEKGRILDELCRNLSYNRAYASRLLSRSPKWKKYPGRKRVYADKTIRHLKILWVKMGFMCSRNMAAVLPKWLRFYDAPEDVKKQLHQISHATIDRKLKPYRAEYRRKLNSQTRGPGNMLRNLVPVKSFDYNRKQPGHLEADTVSHCGGVVHGEYAWTVNYTDVHTGWTTARAIWSKRGDEVLEATEDVENQLPFEILSFNVDCGSEFLNYPLFHYMGPKGKMRRKRQIMTRSRAYHKNDNAFIEQKNNVHVRELFGYARYDHKQLIPLMNSIYKNEHHLLQNFFVPQVKLLWKAKNKSKYIRKYDKPKTPFERLLLSKTLSDEKEQELQQLFDSLDPFELRVNLQKKIKNFLAALRGVSTEKTAA